MKRPPNVLPWIPRCEISWRTFGMDGPPKRRIQKTKPPRRYKHLTVVK